MKYIFDFEKFYESIRPPYYYQWVDYYEILGIKFGASPEEIRKAFRQQAFIWHPDKNQHRLKESEERFKLLNDANEVLSNDQKRKSYDSEYLKRTPKTSSTKQPRTQEPPRPTSPENKAGVAVVQGSHFNNLIKTNNKELLVDIPMSEKSILMKKYGTGKYIKVTKSNNFNPQSYRVQDSCKIMYIRNLEDPQIIREKRIEKNVDATYVPSEDILIVYNIDKVLITKPQQTGRVDNLEIITEKEFSERYLNQFFLCDIPNKDTDGKIYSELERNYGDGIYLYFGNKGNFYDFVENSKILIINNPVDFNKNDLSGIDGVFIPRDSVLFILNRKKIIQQSSTQLLKKRMENKAKSYKKPEEKEKGPEFEKGQKPKQEVMSWKLVKDFILNEIEIVGRDLIPRMPGVDKDVRKTAEYQERRNFYGIGGDTKMVGKYWNRVGKNQFKEDTSKVHLSDVTLAEYGKFENVCEKLKQWVFPMEGKYQFFIEEKELGVLTFGLEQTYLISMFSRKYSILKIYKTDINFWFVEILDNFFELMTLNFWATQEQIRLWDE
ncbi:J domain-containing protein, partial [bacterium]|nr:J domain-containing protein [bacterium]